MGCCCLSYKLERRLSNKNIDKTKNEDESLSGKNTFDVKLEDFTKEKLIGVGTFGKVFLVKLKNNLKYYAMKQMNKESLIKKHQVTNIKDERFMQEKFNHPFVLKLIFAFQDKKNLYLITEFMQGGEFFFHMKNKYICKNEDSAQFYMAQILLAVEYLHKNNIIYRDLKPENVLIDKNGYIKITDFGLSKILKHNEKANTLCGTVDYLAPECLFEKEYDIYSDWFSFGVIMFEIICGYHPFNPKSKNDLDPKIYLAELKFPENVSEDAKDILRKLLVANPRKRLGYKGANEIKKHPFFKRINFDKLINKEITPPFIPQLDGDDDLKYFDREFTDSILVDKENDESLISLGVDFEGFSYQTKDTSLLKD